CCHILPIKSAYQWLSSLSISSQCESDCPIEAYSISISSSACTGADGRSHGFGMNSSDPKKIELREDAWARFERAVDVVAKSPPQHRKAKRKRRKSPKRKKTQ